MLLRDSGEQGDNGYETEEVWHADFSNPIISNRDCPIPVGRVLNTFTSAAPVISISYGKSIISLISACFCHNL